MLKVVYSNSMVQLAAHLADVQSLQPLSPLEAETVIVQSNDLSRWLSLFLAQNHGIVSHINFPFPSAYIWRLFQQLLPDIPQQSAFSTDALSWRIFELLPECRSMEEFAAIDAYLANDDAAVKRYTLANKIADSFDQYLMYRPDWIQAWEQGDKPHWQAVLWQQIVQGESSPKHRANLLVKMHEYLSSLDTAPAELPTRMAIFGISALPPVYMDLFALMATHCQVTLYLLSPSEQYWGDLHDKATPLSNMDDEEPQDYLAVGHPLLASLGKQGQEFFEQLQDYQPEEEQLFIPPDPHCLLANLQHDIYNLTDISAELEPQTIAEDDDSIMVHSCHSAMREIEVLHDQLLALFERHPDMSPTDIVVMTPDIDLYTPWIEAVFGCVDDKKSIPYGIADRGIQRQSPIIKAFNSLLSLPQSRFDVETIMSLLACPAIQLRFSLDEDKLILIRRWLRETHIHWGLSADDKVELGLPANDLNTWRAGLDRLLLGFAMPMQTDNEHWGLFDGNLAFDGISGDRAETMAQLCSFIDQLARYQQRLKAQHSAAKWQQCLLSLLDDFFVISNNNTDEQADLLLVTKTISSFVETIDLAEFEQGLSIDLVKHWIDTHLDSNQSQSRFMGHGVTFCGMVAMRSVPFPVVCLIGMNDGSYPRRQAGSGFDLLSADFRKGDRSRRDDDRYLFLESILSAQSHLYISYVGASIADNALIPPSVLVSDLKDTLQQSYCSEQGQDIWPQLFIQHPLQAFSRRYFDGANPKLFSYVAGNCPAISQSDEKPSWFEHELIKAEDSWRHINLYQLLSFFSHPAKYLMQQRLELRFDNDESQLESREPFELAGLEAWSLRQQLLTYRLQGKNINEAYAMIEASGELPHGMIGRQIFTDQVEQVEQFADKLLAERPEEFIDGVNIDLTIGDFKLSGQLTDLSQQGLFRYQMGKTSAKQLMAVWLEHLVLNCTKSPHYEQQSRLITENNDYQLHQVEQPQQILNDLLNLYWQGLHQPLAFFPKTSLAYAQAYLKQGRADPDKAMNGAWQGNQMISGEGDDLYYQQLYKESPLDDNFKLLALAIFEPLQNHIVGGKL